MDLFWFLVRNNKVATRAEFRRILTSNRILVNNEPISFLEGIDYQLKNNDTVQVGTKVDGWMLYTEEEDKCKQ
jgi:molybdopterin converting factor small subunit